METLKLSDYQKLQALQHAELADLLKPSRLTEYRKLLRERAWEELFRKVA